MPNIGTDLGEEILRLARKEVHRQTSVFRKASAQYRKDIAVMKRQISSLQRKVPPWKTRCSRVFPRCLPGLFAVLQLHAVNVRLESAVASMRERPSWK